MVTTSVSSNPSFLVTNNYRNYSAKSLVSALSGNAPAQHIYFFYGDHVSSIDSNQIEDVVPDYRHVNVNTYRNMIGGKKVNINDASVVIRNVPYVAGIIYDMYDDTDQYLQLKNFFVNVNEGSYYHVYKCLDNNGKSVSSVQPTFADIQSSSSFLYQTSDGYKWKYMYSVPSSLVTKFSTTDYFPVTANTQVQNSAVLGALDVIKISDGGRGYDNYIYGTLSGADIKINGNNSLYAIAASNAENSNGFYTGCLMYLSDGVGRGQYSRVVNYFSTPMGKYVNIDPPFTITPTNGSTYQITPEVLINGDGGQTVNAVARALINAVASNSIYRVEILDRGLNYSYFTANAVANDVVSITKSANLVPIYSPIKGHGYDPTVELFGNSVMISVSLNGNESNTLPTVNKYHQVGFIKNPLFANVHFSFANQVGSFLRTEKLCKITTSKYFDKTCVVNTTSNILSCNTADFLNQFKQGQLVLVKTDTNAVLATVNSIVNSTAISLNSVPVFANTAASLYSANIHSSAIITSVDTQNTVSTTNCSVGFATNDYVIGCLSGSTGYISNIDINGVTKPFNTYIQLNKYGITTKSGTLAEDEIVYQYYIDFANASYFATVPDNSNTYIYTSNQVGAFVTNTDIIGNTTGAIVTINSKYSGDLVFGSGDVLYVENIDKVDRTSGNTETFKFIFEF